MTTRRCVKLVIVGDHGVGKTQFMEKYMCMKFLSKFDSRIGLPYYQKMIKCTKEDDHEIVYIQIYVVTGLHRFNSLPAEYYYDSMGFLIMYDVTVHHTIYNIAKWFTEIKLHSKDDSSPVVLCGNKYDKRLSFVLPNEIKKLFKQNYFNTSAMMGLNVHEPVDFLLATMLTRMGFIDVDQSLEEYLRDDTDQSCCCIL